MKFKFILSTTLCFLLAFILNLFSHHSLSVALTNSFLLVLSIYFFQSFLNKSYYLSYLIIISFSLIPLFNYLPYINLISLLPLISLSFFILYKRWPKKWILIFFAISLFVGNIYSGEIIKYPLNLQDTQLIFNSPEINYHIKRHTEDALFLPFKMRQLLYSKLVYIYAAFTNFFDFLNLKNISDVLLIANIYPLFMGFSLLFKQEKVFRNFCLMAFFVTLFTAGIDRSPDKFQSLYLLSLIFLFLIILGLQKINKTFYLSLWVLTLFLLVNPKI